jgi:hypothetical protein
MRSREVGAVNVNWNQTAMELAETAFMTDGSCSPP